MPTPELQEFEPRLLAAFPYLAAQFLADLEWEQTALVIRDDSTAGEFVFRVFPLAQGMGTAALQILEQLSETPRKVAALVSAFRVSGSDGQSEQQNVQISATLATYGAQRFYFEEFWGHPYIGELESGGLINVGSGDPLTNDDRHFALNCSLTV